MKGETGMKKCFAGLIALMLLLYCIPALGETAADTLPSLKEVYAGKFDFGSAAPSRAFTDYYMQQLMLAQFSILTPENELKPDSVLDSYMSKKQVKETGDETAVAVRFNAAKPLLDFAKKNGIKVHGHTLLWHQQTPESFFHEGYEPNKPFVSREVMLGRMENYIKAVMEYLDENYPGVVVSWDVVNEAISDGTNALRKSSNWYTTIGDDYVARAFEFARKYAPEGTLLYYNDYNTATPGKLSGIVKLLQPLIAEGTIDGYGFQMHHTVSSHSLQMIANAVEKIAGLGLKIRVSELDIGIDRNTDQNLQKQADKYGAIMRLLLQYSDQVEAVQVWGITDRMSWRASSFPLLFDGNMKPKPAFWAVADPQSVQ